MYLWRRRAARGVENIAAWVVKRQAKSSQNPRNVRIWAPSEFKLSFVPIWIRLGGNPDLNSSDPAAGTDPNTEPYVAYDKYVCMHVVVWLHGWMDLALVSLLSYKRSAVTLQRSLAPVIASPSNDISSLRFWQFESPLKPLWNHIWNHSVFTATLMKPVESFKY